MPFPQTPGDITPAYLTTLLRDSNIITKSSVESVEVRNVPEGSGFVAQSAHLSVRYDNAEPGAPAALFVKLSSANPAVREQLRAIGIYETETGFYRDLGGDNPLHAPRAYAALYEPQTGESLVLLEEIGHMRFGDNLNGATLEQARTAMVNLAQMQARYWNKPILERCRWLRSLANDLVEMTALNRSLHGVFEQRWSSIAPESVLQATRALRDNMEHWYETQLIGPWTLVHGDFRPDNFAFEEDGALRVFDWQTTRRGPPSVDAAYFQILALPVELRRAHEAALLELYHGALVEHGVREYSLDDVRANHRRSVGSAVSRIVTAGALLDFSSPRGQQLMRAFLERVAAGVEDHEFTPWVTACGQGDSHGAA